MLIERNMANISRTICTAAEKPTYDGNSHDNCARIQWSSLRHYQVRNRPAGLAVVAGCWLTTLVWPQIWSLSQIFAQGFGSGTADGALADQLD